MAAYDALLPHDYASAAAFNLFNALWDELYK